MGQSKVINHQAIKDYNRNKILKLLSEKRQLTKQDIAIETRISIPTVTNNIDMLIKEGIVKEAGMARSTGGRRAMTIQYLPDSKHSFGIDISPENVHIALSNLDGNLSHCETLAFRKGDLAVTIKEISSRIQIIRNKYGIKEQNILGVGFSLPGTVNRKTLALEMAPNLGLKDVSFTQFEKTLGYQIFIENEANAGALAEQIKGNRTTELVYISITHGVGCGIIKDGQLYRGKNQRAGEFGHMSVETKGKKCSCGRTGCWELYVSNCALLERYAGLSRKRSVSIEKFISLVNEGDRFALKAWDQYLDYLAMGVENIILGIDPGAVIIGGDIARLGDLLVNPLRERVFIANNFDTIDDITIGTSLLGNDAPIIGAAMLPVWNFLYS